MLNTHPCPRAFAPEGNPRSPPEAFIPSLPTLSPGALLAPRGLPLARWPGFLGGRLHLFYLARAGVYRAVRHLLSGSPGTVLMPAYHHGVEVEAVRAAGATVRFYRVDDDMTLDLEDLERRARAPDVRLLYVTHYVGFAQPILEVRALADRLGLPLFEDCALALFSRTPHGLPLGETGDAACFCLYKTLPVPHGGLLRAPEDLGAKPGAPPPLLSTLHHAAGLLLGGLELAAPRLGRTVRAAARGLARRTVDTVVENVQTGTQHLGPRDLTLGASRLVGHLLARVEPGEVVRRRRRNFARLVEALGPRARVVGFPLARGVCPLFLPVRVPDKARVLARLRARGVDAIDFWSGGDPDCPPHEFPEAARLRREILELPCHQALDDDAIDRLAAIARPALAG